MWIPNTTSVGVGDRKKRLEGRQGREEKAAHHARRAAFAEKIGFDAYGTTRDMPDPVANAIDALLDHVHAMDQQLETMCKSMKQLGMEIDPVKLPDLGPCEIASTQTRLEPEEDQPENK